MEPLTPNDPLWKVLGQAKPVQARPNFTQNVVRLARQTPQDRGWLARFKSWWQEQDSARAGLTWAAAAALVITAATFIYQPEGASSQSQVALVTPIPVVETTAVPETDFPLIPEFETEWKNLEQVGDLLAVHDSSLLTDSEINMLLY
ncbi:hypothetical protein EI77_03295 [Prosthecobacter fusiformis]|uniref:Uncharacterized protein n=1 Tax=Prosthecobacter fusiformis TaxID=48464 RepID=A0A4R7RT85_9BACT|nr:hypothetical protein [Prosthecobacter fusiformis]TDU68178.1 hypothetical protein EI77_03295 [Prosthecobacter fusiformis]